MRDLLWRYFKYHIQTNEGFIVVAVLTMMYFLFLVPNFPSMITNVLGIPLGVLFTYSAIQSSKDKK